MCTDLPSRCNAHEFAQKSQGDHQELQIEPVVAELQERLVLNNRPRLRSPVILFFPGASGEQAVDSVGELQAAQNEYRVIVYLRPVAAPMEVNTTSWTQAWM